MPIFQAKMPKLLFSPNLSAQTQMSSKSTPQPIHPAIKTQGKLINSNGTLVLSNSPQKSSSKITKSSTQKLSQYSSSLMSNLSSTKQTLSANSSLLKSSTELPQSSYMNMSPMSYSGPLPSKMSNLGGAMGFGSSMGKMARLRRKQT